MIQFENINLREPTCPNFTYWCPLSLAEAPQNSIPFPNFVGAGVYNEHIISCTSHI